MSNTDVEYLEGRWYCLQCQSFGQRGIHEKCQNCGAPRPADVTFYLPEDAPVITDTQEVEKAKAGPDWICAFCASSVGMTHKTCPQCGSSRDTTLQQPVFSIGPEQTQPEVAPAPPRTISSPPKRNYVPIFGVGLLLLVFGSLIWLFSSHPIQLTVSQLNWERTIKMEEFRTLHETDWTVPPGGRLTGSSEEVHGYVPKKVGERRIACHPGGHREKTGTRSITCHPGGHREKTGTRRFACGTRSLGNGRFERKYCTEPTYTTRSCSHRCSEDVYEQIRCAHQCTEDVFKDFPVYATKYQYDIDRWVSTSSLRLVGQGKDRHWPTPVIDATHREVERIETLTAVFVDRNGKAHSLRPPEPYWASLTPGEHCEALIYNGGSLADTPQCPSHGK